WVHMSIARLRRATSQVHSTPAGVFSAGAFGSGRSLRCSARRATRSVRSARSCSTGTPRRASTPAFVYAPGTTAPPTGCGSPSTMTRSRWTRWASTSLAVQPGRSVGTSQSLGSRPRTASAEARQASTNSRRSVIGQQPPGAGDESGRGEAGAERQTTPGDQAAGTVAGGQVDDGGAVSGGVGGVVGGPAHDPGAVGRVGEHADQVPAAPVAVDDDV